MAAQYGRQLKKYLDHVIRSVDLPQILPNSLRIQLLMRKYDICSKMAAQDGHQSKNDLDHITCSVELPLVMQNPTGILQRCGRL